MRPVPSPAFRSVVDPLHSIDLAAHRLRFFRPPLPGPHLPWHSADDLQRCLDLPPAARLKILRDNPFRAATRTVATPEGIATIAPHFMAQGLIAGALDFGLIQPGFESSYVKGAMAALRQLMGDLPPMARLAFALTAFDNDGASQ